MARPRPERKPERRLAGNYRCRRRPAHIFQHGSRTAHGSRSATAEGVQRAVVRRSLEPGEAECCSREWATRWSSIAEGESTGFDEDASLGAAS
jgi:hypothetical protein